MLNHAMINEFRNQRFSADNKRKLNIQIQLDLGITPEKTIYQQIQSDIETLGYSPILVTLVKEFCIKRVDLKDNAKRNYYIYLALFDRNAVLN